MQSGQPMFVDLSLALECLVQAQRGCVEEAREAGERMSAGEEDPPARLMSWAGLGHLELSLGRADHVPVSLEPGVSFVRRERILEPGATRFVVDHVEALIELTRADEAVELLGWYEGNAQLLGRSSALANCARCRDCLPRRKGAWKRRSPPSRAHSSYTLPSRCPSTAAGRCSRSAPRSGARSGGARRARRSSRPSIVFERIGARLWSERARDELKRISGRAATPGALTPAEERVAALVAEGKTNREVAAALFLSDRTVEGHLAHVFGKLGIRHRTELAAALAARQTQGIAASNTGDSPVSAGPSAP